MIKKALQYGISGGTAFVLDFAFLYALFAYTSLTYVIAVPLAFVFGTLVNYSINHFWTFRGNSRTLTRGYVNFLQIALVGVLATLGIVALLVEVFHVNTLVSRIIAAGLVFAWSFAANYFLNFKAHKAPVDIQEK